MEEVQIINTTSRELNEDWIKSVVRSALKEINQEGPINIIFVGPRKMRSLNRYFRGKNKVTDVLSFPYHVNLQEFPFSPKEEDIKGEIVICYRELQKRHKRTGEPLEKILAEVLIHGTLHLFGYDHKNPKEAKEMFSLQNKILEKILSTEKKE